MGNSQSWTGGSVEGGVASEQESGNRPIRARAVGDGSKQESERTMPRYY